MPRRSPPGATRRSRQPATQEDDLPGRPADQFRLRRETATALRHYVYAYIDPRNGLPFYVGKGVGRRAHAHEDGRGNPATAKRIAEIRKAGKVHRIDILAHGFDNAETAFRVEAAAIDLVGREKLTNLVRGYGSLLYGRQSLEELNLHLGAKPAKIVDPVLLIRINRLYRPDMTPIELYEATRGIWRLRPRETVKYAFAVFEGVVREVYTVKSWHRGGTTPYQTRDRKSVDKPSRWEFKGRVAPAPVRDRYRYRRVDAYFSERSQNPISYVEC